MKKKLIMGIGLLLAISIVLSGCGSGESSKNEFTQLATDFFTAMKDGEYDKVEEISDGVEVAAVESDKDVYPFMLKYLEWELGEPKVDGETATLDVKVKNKKIADAVQNALAFALDAMVNNEATQEEAGAVFNEKLPTTIEEADMGEIDTVMKFKKVEDKWIIERDEALMRSLFLTEVPPEAVIPEGGEIPTGEEAPVETETP